MHVFYDFETTGTSPAFDQPLQFAAILTDDEFNEKESVNIRCDLADYILPSPIALALTKVSPKNLFGNKLSYYEFSRQITALISKWTPATWIGHNSIRFDENVLRQMFYQNLEGSMYKTQIGGNSRLDTIRAVQACWAFASSAITVPTGPDGKLTTKLEHLAVANGFNEHIAHDALGDVRATIFIARLMREKAPDIWEQILSNMNREKLRRRLNSGEVFYLVERFGGGPPRIFTGVYCGTHDGNDKKVGFLDLNIGPTEGIVAADESAIQKAVTKSPLAIRTVDIGTMPLLFPATNVGADMAATALKIVKNDKLLSVVGKMLAKKDAEREKPTLLELKIYTGFYNKPDSDLTDKFHASNWPDRHGLLASMKDVRLAELGGRLCSLYAPKSVPANFTKAFWGMIKGRWDGTVSYGDDDKNPGNTYASVAADLAKLADGKSFPIEKQALHELTEFFDGRKL